MKTDGKQSDVDKYLSGFDPEIRTKLEIIRQTIMKAAPGSEERISYMMPTFFNNGVLIHYAAFKKHIGIFPGSSGIEAFKEELADFDCSKGTIRIPFDRELPLKLISEIARFRLEENRMKAEMRSKKKKSP